MREIRFTKRAKEITIWISVAVILYFLHSTAHLLTPFIWAIVATYIFHPLVSFLSRESGVPRAIWIILLYIAVFSAVAWSLINVVPIIRDQSLALANQVPHILNQIEGFINRNQMLREWGISVDLKQLESQVVALSDDFADYARRMAVPILTVVIDKAVKFFIFLVATFFLLLHADHIKSSFLEFTPAPYRHEIESLLRRINDTLGAYLRSQLILLAIMTIATWIFLSTIHVQYALLLGVLTGFLELIPIIGPYTAGGIAVSVALFQSNPPFGWNNLTLAAVVALGYFILRQLEDNLVIPFLIGRVVHLNPIIVIFFIMAGASYGGILGLLIAVPIASVLRIIAQYLYSKIIAPEPAFFVTVSKNDNPIEQTVRAIQSGARRIVLISTEGNDALRDHGTFQQLVNLMNTEDVEITVIAPDSVTQALATAHGMRLNGNGY